MSLTPRMPAGSGVDIPAWCATERIAASHLVAHDAIARSPRERAAMLRDVGIRSLIWDWRASDLARVDVEFDALRAEGIDVTGLWTPLPMPDHADPDHPERFGIVPPRIKQLITDASRRGLRPDLWTQVAFGEPGQPPAQSEAERQRLVQRAADHLTGLARLARGHGMCVLLTNHGGWAGEPRTLVDVVTELARRGMGNVGIGFRLQHAHHLVADLDTHLATMRDHLVALMLSGMDAGAVEAGRAILPMGAGSRDRWVTHAILESGWEGQLVIHAVGHDDSRDRLLDSIEGWQWCVDRAHRRLRHRPTPRVLEPTWPPPESARRVAPTTARARERAEAAEPAHVIDPAPRRTGPTPYGQTAPPTVPANTRAAADFVSGGRTATATAPAAAPPQAPAPPAPSSLPARTPPPPPAPSAAAPASPPPAPPIPPEAAAWARRRSTPVTDLGPSRRERRARREEQERAARAATKAAREATRRREALATEGPERIGHDDVKIVAPDPYSGAIHALLLHLEDSGFTGAPRSFGWDDRGRHLVEYVPGLRADHPDAPASALDPYRIGRFVRSMHDALEGFEPPEDARWFEGLPAPGGDLVVHMDIAPSNIVVREDGSLVAIDWDAAGPGTRLWDLAHTAHAFTPLYRADADLTLAGHRLRRLVDGYGLSSEDRVALVPLLAQRSQRMYEYLNAMRLTGESPWIDLWERGVGTVWRSDSQWIRQHESTWLAALLA